MTAILDTIGRFHPLLLHLPIGIFVYAYLHLGYDLYIGKKKRRPVDIHFALLIGCVTAVFSSISGYLLAMNGEYEGELLDWHKWLGVGTAAGSITLLFMYQLMLAKRSFFGVFTLFVILLGITGHYGGSLTHGAGFLSSNSNNKSEPKIIENVNEAHVFNDLVMPIVKRKCTSCHNPKKKKGDLLLHSLDGWKKGGKSGDFVTPGNLETSLFSARMHLPLSEEEHMPPSGKLQLEEEEMSFIDWWIKSMNNFDHRLQELSPPEHILNYLNKEYDKSTAGVPSISQLEIDQLQKSGVPAIRIGKDSPWLAVEYARGSEVTKKELKKLAQYKENIRELKLSRSGLNDKLMSQLNKFVNLRVLDLSLNKISSNGVSKLKDLSKLEVLNVYGTDVDAEMISHLSSFPELKDLYVWQTKIAENNFDNLALPKGVNLIKGQNMDVFATVKLLPPTFESEYDIFTDTARVKISHVAGNAKIFYTTDGQDPTTNSSLYSEEIVLDRTSEVRAISTMEGWDESDVISKSFLKSGSAPIACEILPSPNEKYKGEGDSTLINFIKGSEQFGDGQWLGFSAQDVAITLDLGEVKDVSAISFGSLQDYKSYIFNPVGSSVSTSVDGEKFEVVKEDRYAQISGPTDIQIRNYILKIPPTAAQYIKLDITAQKKNPKWHSAPGADCWLFLDEVVVE